ncbi:putative six-bladed beta-propeller, TolB [Lupinus albus]|uniref:Putative six-bladed beta-propeller, TolB n=1 Tax=Lupinus albus TaxID=3870 RepID=A0A6A4NZL3_LUPAL|nr:putative six-bladed beta-propeller, TolB [Lupinus albus]
MGDHVLVLYHTLILLFFTLSLSAAPSTTSPSRTVNGFLSNSVPAFTKWFWSLKPTTKTVSSRSMMKFESGYNVETVFDGSKLGIEPYAVEVLPNGELLILDSANSNVYRISSSLSLYSRPKLVAGSAQGYSGHVDGKVREARMSHPKGIAVDDRGNIYVADTSNMAIRKISDSGVTTIAGGKWSRFGGHVDGPSEEAKFSDDFDVVYVGSSCSLLVIDRGNRAIREIQLRFDDCAYQYGSEFPLGIALLAGAGFFGYMLALLQRRLGTIVAIQDAQAEVPVMPSISLTQSEFQPHKLEEGFLGSLKKLIANTGSSMVKVMGGLLPGFGKTPQSMLHPPQKQQANAWPVQESFVIPNEDEPPSIDTRTPTPRKTYAFMSKDAEGVRQLRKSKAFYSGWDGDVQQQQQKHHNRHEYSSSMPHTYYEQSHETTNEIVFGAVQEHDAKQESVVIKPVDYGASLYDDHHNIRSRMSSMGYTYKY